MKILLTSALLLFGLMTLSWPDQNQLRLISVTGDAEIKVVPDEVVLVLGVETSNLILKDAKYRNDQAVRAVMAVTDRYGIDRKNVQTDYFTIDPRYEDRPESGVYKHIFTGYFIRKNIVITLKDMSKYEDVLSGVLEAGANYVEGIQFMTTDLRKYRDQARENAIGAAKEKAEALAGKLGIKIGRAFSISEDGGYWYYGNNNQRFAGQMQNASSYAGNDGAAGPEGSTISPGQISVTARVSVSFELE